MGNCECMSWIQAVAPEPSKSGRLVTSQDLAKGFYACTNGQNGQESISMNGPESVCTRDVNVMGALDGKFNGKYNFQEPNGPMLWVKESNPNIKIQMDKQQSVWELHDGATIRYRSPKGAQFLEWPDTEGKEWSGVGGTKGTCKIGCQDRRTKVKTFQDYNKCVFQLKVTKKATNKTGKANRLEVGTCFFAKVRLKDAPETPVLVTAAHCLQSKDLDGTIWEACGVTVKVTNNSGGNGKDWPFERHEWSVPDQYLKNKDACDGYDVAVIRLAALDLDCITKQLGTGLHLAVNEQSAQQTKGSVIVCGFPADRVVKDENHVPLFYMWECSGAVVEETTSSRGCIKYNLDTAGGQSGSPVISQSKAGNARLVTGVHVAADQGEHNLGIKLTEATLAWLKENMQCKPK